MGFPPPVSSTSCVCVMSAAPKRSPDDVKVDIVSRECTNVSVPVATCDDGATKVYVGAYGDFSVTLSRVPLPLEAVRASFQGEYDTQKPVPAPELLVHALPVIHAWAGSDTDAFAAERSSWPMLDAAFRSATGFPDARDCEDWQLVRDDGNTSVLLFRQAGDADNCFMWRMDTS